MTIDFSVEAVGRTSATYRVELSVGGDQAAVGTLVVVLTANGRPQPWPDDARTLLVP